MERCHVYSEHSRDTAVTPCDLWPLTPGTAALHEAFTWASVANGLFQDRPARPVQGPVRDGRPVDAPVFVLRQWRVSCLRELCRASGTVSDPLIRPFFLSSCNQQPAKNWTCMEPTQSRETSVQGCRYWALDFLKVKDEKLSLQQKPWNPHKTS